MIAELVGLIRLASFALGSALVISSLFLYEDQEGRIRSVLEDLWIRIDDSAIAFQGFHVAFARTTATAAKEFLGRLYGPKVLSYQVAVVSIHLGLSAAAFALLLAELFTDLSARYVIGSDETVWMYWMRLLAYVYLIVGSFRSATADVGAMREINWRRRFWRIAVVTGVLLVSCGIALMSHGQSDRMKVDPQDFSAQMQMLNWQLVIILYPVAFLTLSWLIDCLALGLTRTMLEYLSNASSLFAVIAIEFGSLLGVAITLGLPLVFLEYGEHAAFLVMLLIVSDIFAVAACAAFSLLALSLVLHRALWNTIERPLYLLARSAFGEHRITVAIIGFALIAYALPGAAPIIRKIVDVLRA